MNKKWLKSEDDYLLSNYARGNKNNIIKALGRTWSSIQSRASRLNLKKINANINGCDVEIWSNEEIEFLKFNYQKMSRDLIISKLNRTWSSIQNKAFLLRIKRNCLSANISKLINKTNEAYYWLGFIMADGHFSNSCQIQINLAEKDLHHLKKFANYIEYKNNLIKPNISVGFSDIRSELENIFDISNNKTYFPCKLNGLSGDSLFSFIIGFIDGDGSINTKGYLTLVSHKNWLNNICFMLKEISNGKHYSCKINKSDLSSGYICNIETMKLIKQKALELNLPILERKWSRVNETKLSKKERSVKIFNKCFELFSEGLTVNEVIQITNLSKSIVYKQYSVFKKKL